MGTELKEKIAVNAANEWCRCFKCDGKVNATGNTCEKDKLLTCRKWYDGYRTALLALEEKEVDLDKFGEIARHLIAVKEHIEDIRLNKEEWLMLEKIGYPKRIKVQKGE